MDDDLGEGLQPEAMVQQASSATGRPPASARCSRCGRAQLALLRNFAVGNGSAYRTLIDDVYCLHCGLIGQPTYELSDSELTSTGTEIGRRSLKRVEPGA